MALSTKEKEKCTEELQKQQRYETVELQRDHVLKKNLFTNLSRSLQQSKNEQDEEERMENSKTKELTVQAQIDSEERLAQELNTCKRTFVNREKERQMLRETSIELRELESKLRAAYVNKEIQVQIAEKEYSKRLNQKIDKEACELLRGSVEKEQELKKQRLEKEMRDKYEYRKQLQDQMMSKEQSKRSQYKEFLREKKLLDEIVQKIYEEDERELQERMRKMQKTREEMDSFKTVQQLRKDREKRLIEEEDRRIESYLKNKDTGDEKRLRAKQEQETKRAQLCDKIARDVYEQVRKRREREDICLALMEEEQKEEQAARHRREIEKSLRDKLETRTSLKQQMQDNLERQKEEILEAERYKEQLIAKLAEDERLDLLSNENKRRKMLLLRKDVEEMMIEKRRRIAEEHQLALKLHEEEERNLEERKRLIKKERIRMLEEHAKNLIGYLPKGILEEDELEHLDVPRKFDNLYKN